MKGALIKYSMFYYIIEEGGLDYNGKLFDEKLEEGNGVLVYRNIIIMERYKRLPRDEK